MRDDGTMSPGGWQRVESFGGALPDEHLLSVLASAAGRKGQRLRSPEGLHALVVPIDALPASVAVDVRVPRSTSVMFVEPATAGSALGAASAIGDMAPAPLLALPEGQTGSALVREPGRVTVTLANGASLEYGLFRPPARETSDLARLRSAPSVAESDDVTESRARWFGARESL